eukprot:gene21752-biopygen10198
MPAAPLSTRPTGSPNRSARCGTSAAPNGAKSLPSCSLEHKGRAQGVLNAYPLHNLPTKQSDTQRASLQCALQTPNFLLVSQGASLHGEDSAAVLLFGHLRCCAFCGGQCRSSRSVRKQSTCCLTRANTDCERRRHRGKHGVEREETVLCLASKAPGNWKYDIIPPSIAPERPMWAPLAERQRSETPHRHLEAATWQGGKGSPIAISTLARVLGSEWRERISVHKAIIRRMHGGPGLAGPPVRQRKQGAACSTMPPFPTCKRGVSTDAHPIRVGYGTLVEPPESRKFRVLLDLDACWTPQLPPPLPGVSIDFKCLNMQIGGYGGATGAAREENEENAAPQALPGARIRATPQRYVLLCYVLPCSVMFCSMLVYPVLFCSGLP